MTELARADTVGAFDPRNEQIVKYLGLNPADPKSVAVVAVARRYDLDPLLKHVIIIESKGKANVYITRDGLLHVAHQSGVLDGIVVDQEPALSDDGREWVARVSVWRKDMGHPFTFPGRYPVNGLNREYPQEMALKAAESHALRRAFSVAGLPAYDEQRAERAQARAAAAGRPPVTAAEIMHADDAAVIEPEPTVPDLLAKLGVESLSDRLALISLYVSRPIRSLEDFATLKPAEHETVVAALETIAGQDDEGRAADLARDLAEARDLAAQRDPQ